MLFTLGESFTPHTYSMPCLDITPGTVCSANVHVTITIIITAEAVKTPTETLQTVCQCVGTMELLPTVDLQGNYVSIEKKLYKEEKRSKKKKNHQLFFSV